MLPPEEACNLAKSSVYGSINLLWVDKNLAKLYRMDSPEQAAEPERRGEAAELRDRKLGRLGA